MGEKINNVCPVCGYAGLCSVPYKNMGGPPWRAHGTPPYEKRYGLPSYEVCSCCGFEFGNDDNSGTAESATFDQYRMNWIDRGAEWFDKSKKPADWDLQKQLSAAGINDSSH
jgi:hypothetical protein